MRLSFVVLAFLFSVSAHAKFTFKNYHGAYMLAIGGGGSSLLSSVNLSPDNHFDIEDTTGGSLFSGDFVCLKSIRGFYVVAESGGGRMVNANRTACGPWEKFRIWKVNSSGGRESGVIHFPTRVAFQSENGSWVVAEPNGRINANRPAMGPWEIFWAEWR